MDSVIPKSLQDAIDALEQLPGVGPRSAERYAYYLLKSDSNKSQVLADSLKNLHRNIKYCPKTFALIQADEDLSPLYKNPKRDKTVVAVVADPFDIVALEKTHSFSGTYHVLGGLVSERAPHY
jgi:recombination protein RecR